MPEKTKVKSITLNTTKNIIYFHKEEFDKLDGGCLIDEDGTALMENDFHVYICENYE